MTTVQYGRLEADGLYTILISFVQKHWTDRVTVGAPERAHTGKKTHNREAQLGQSALKIEKSSALFSTH